MTTESIHNVTEKGEIPASPPIVNVWTVRSLQKPTFNEKEQYRSEEKTKKASPARVNGHY
jgi:hypothetical protein